MTRSLIVSISFWMALSQVGSASEGRSLAGEVVRIVDGDTLEIRTGKKVDISIRLAQIDAPEAAQPYGEEATKALAALSLGKRVRVEVVALDRYGRTVGEVYAGALHINSEMVRGGHAWAYTQYVETLEIIDVEAEARRLVRGLWRLLPEEREPPWVWRHRQREAKAIESEGQTADTVCGEKRTCSEMVSCAEAKFYLVQCGVTRLDGDSDGIPCESRCPR